MAFFVAVQQGFLTGEPRKHPEQQRDLAKADIHYAKPFDTWRDADETARTSGWPWWAIVENSHATFGNYVRKVEFKNAQRMASIYPDTFHAPSKMDLDSVKKDSIVKVCTSNERFWTIVHHVVDDNVLAVVDNDLVFTDKHGLRYGDMITFKLENIYQIAE